MSANCKIFINFAVEVADSSQFHSPFTIPGGWITASASTGILSGMKSESMTNNNRILLISQEIAPYLSGSQAAFGKALAQGMQENGFEVRTFMPKFGNINERRNQLHEVIRLSGVNIIIDDNDHPLIIKVASLQPSRIQVYFIDNDDFFLKEDEDIDPAGSNRSDNDERIIFYSRGTLETAKKLRWEPRVIHCAGWFSSLIPLYLKRIYNDDPSFKGAKIVYTVTPDRVSAPIDERFLTKLKADGIPARDIKKFTNVTHDTDLLHKMGVDYSHAVVVTDPQISPELLQYMKDTGKPCLIVENPEEAAAQYAAFFKSL